MKTVAALALSALAFASSAEAGTLQLDKRGIAPAYVWIDGEPQGKLRKRDGMTIENLPEGKHEVWVAWEQSGLQTRCFGVVEVLEFATVNILDRGCQGLQLDQMGDRTAFRGGFIEVSTDDTLEHMLLDGDRVTFTFADRLNVAPGMHTLQFVREIGEEDVVVQAGMVNVQHGNRYPVMCSVLSCVGMDSSASGAPLAMP